jgi:hypothetical protein
VQLAPLQVDAYLLMLFWIDDPHEQILWPFPSKEAVPPWQLELMQRTPLPLHEPPDCSARTSLLQMDGPN